MFLVGLSGGVGSGKSAAAELFARHGTYLIDADQVAREVVEPGTPGLLAIIDRFGPEFLLPDGHLDRNRLAAKVFASREALDGLNAIVHPLVRKRIGTELENLAADDRQVVLLSVPLFVESGQYATDCLIVVDTPEALAMDRAIAQRGWSQAHAQQRVAAQATRQERLAAADYVIDNSGSLADLADRVAEAWGWIEARAGRKTL